MYTVTEVAKMFSVSRQTVLKWINNGKIKAVKVVKVYRIPKEEIDRLIDKQRKEDEGEMKERKYLAISIKHTEWKWKFGKPCILWGWHQTKDDEKRCFADYTQYPNKAEVYSLQDWLDSGYGDIIKMDEPVHMTIDLCKKYKNYDTVLIDKEEYIGYCKMSCLPLAHPTEKGGVDND